MTEFTSVSDLLVSWGFQKYVDEFMRNEVDIIALGLLDDYQICTLIPSIGPQAKFKKALSDWKALQVPAGPSDLDDIDGFNAIISDYGDSLGGRTPSLTSPIGTPVVSPGTSLSVVSGVTSHLHRNLTTLLEKTQDGQLLLRRGQQPLGEQCRKILAREIGTQIVKSDPKASVTADTYIHWIQEIKRVFPAENSSIYYTGPPDGLRRSHGRLYDAVTNLKAKYRRNKIYQPRARRSLEKTIIPVLSTSTHQRPALVIEDLITASETTENTHEDLQECLEWLHSSADNYALCAEKWSKTSQQRLQRVLSEKETHSYLREFPGLSRSWGYTLLTADFHKWYPGNEDSFENKFPLLKNKLLSVSENISRKSSFVTKLRMLAVDPNPETSTLAVLLLIPHLLGPVHIKKKKSSAAEVRESFILHIEEERQLREEIQKRQEKYKALNITVQPFIVVVGALENITTRYLIVEGIIYELTSISRTVDTCFKIIWALYLEYPLECLPVWQFLQRAIYDIPSKAIDQKEKVPTSVLGLLNDCGISIK